LLRKPTRVLHKIKKHITHSRKPNIIYLDDTADNKAVQLAIDINKTKVYGGKDSVGDASGINASLLSGRSPLVLIVRELMFRACELSVHQNLSKKETISLYKNFLEIANTMSKNIADDDQNVKEVVNKSNDDNDDDDNNDN